MAKSVSRKDRVRSIAAEFAVLADRFESWRAVQKVQHLCVHLAANSERAGRLLHEAVEAGVFAQESWWRDDWVSGFVQPLIEKAEFSTLWTLAIGSWLVKRYPGRFRQNAESWDWLHVATDKHGRPIGKNGKALRWRWYKDGKPLPLKFTWTKQHGAGYARRLDGEIAHAEDFYDEADALEHHRTRAEVYADACRVLAEFCRESTWATTATNGIKFPDTHGNRIVQQRVTARVARIRQPRQGRNKRERNRRVISVSGRRWMSTATSSSRATTKGRR